MTNYEMPPVHPAAELFPMMTDAELLALAEDIKANGLQQPVVMFGAKLLDGRNRWRACQIAGIEPKLRDWNGADAVAYVRSLNLHRRHLTPAQRAALAVKAEPIYAEAAAKKQDEGRKKGGQLRGGNRPQAQRDESARALAQAARTTGASLDSAKQMKQVAQKAPEVVELVQRGQVETVADAKRVASVPDDRRAEVVALVRAGLEPSQAVDSVVSDVGFAEKARVLFDSVAKKASALSSACMRLVEFLEQYEASISGPEAALIRAKAYQARANITDIIKLIEKGKGDV